MNGNQVDSGAPVDVFGVITSESVAGVLRGAVADPSTLSHAWLFTGPPGSGRSVAARAFAAALVCPEGGCGDCEQCRAALRGSHPDVVWLQTQGVTILVDQVKSLIREAASLPSVASRRVIVVEDADRLNETSANALLKSVEEPSEHTVFILCAPSTDPQDIAITLRSRCRHVYVPTPPPDAVTAVLLRDASLGLTAEQAAWAASVSGGHIGRARHLAKDEVARKKRATALTLPARVYEPAGAYGLVGELLESAHQEMLATVEPLEAAEIAELEAAMGVGASGRGAAKLLRGTKGQTEALLDEHKRRRRRLTADYLDLALIDVAGLYRDAMMLALGAVGQKQDGEPVGGFIHPDMRSTSAELARRNSPEVLLQCIDAVLESRALLTSAATVQPATVLAALAGRLAQLCHVVR